MNRKGLSAVVGTVLLVGISLLIAGIIFAWGRNYVAQLSPPIQCDGVSFRAEILSGQDGFFLSVVNEGTIPLEGFSISVVGTGEKIFVEEVSVLVPPGGSEEKDLKSSYSDGVFIIAPEIRASDDKIRVCAEAYGIEASFGAVG